MIKWKWLFVKGCKCKTPVQVATEVSNSYQRWDKSIRVFGNCVEDNDVSVELVSYSERYNELSYVSISELQ